MSGLIKTSSGRFGCWLAESELILIHLWVNNTYEYPLQMDIS